MVSDLVSGGKRMVMMPYNSTWRNIRKLMHQVLLMSNILILGVDVAGSGKV
jgi:hypothetical protein